MSEGEKCIEDIHIDKIHINTSMLSIIAQLPTAMFVSLAHQMRSICGGVKNRVAVFDGNRNVRV